MLEQVLAASRQDEVGQLPTKTRNASAPGSDRMEAEIMKVLWKWVPGHITAPARARIKLGRRVEDSQGSGHPQTGEAGLHTGSGSWQGHIAPRQISLILSPSHPLTLRRPPKTRVLLVHILHAVRNASYTRYASNQFSFPSIPRPSGSWYVATN